MSDEVFTCTAARRIFPFTCQSACFESASLFTQVTRCVVLTPVSSMEMNTLELFAFSCTVFFVSSASQFAANSALLIE